MSVDSFKKALWEAAILESLKGITVAEIITTPPSSVEGSKATFNTASLTKGVQDYTGKVDWENATTVPIDLEFNKKKYFAFSVDDCDKVQLAGDLMLPLTRQCAYDIKKQIDTDVLAEAVAKAPAGNTLGTKAAQIAIASPEEAYNLIVDLGTKLDNNDAPEMDRYVAGRPEFINMLAKDKRVIDNATVLPNGIVQGMEINGMQVIKSNNVPANQVIALSKLAVGFGKQLDETEAMRLQNAFADGIRGLCQYGTVALRPSVISLLHYKMGA